MIVDKPSGLLVIPTPKNEKRTLTNILNEELKRNGLAYRLHPCHRLDRETSGLIIYAKGKSMQRKMSDIFKTRRIRKTYIAFVQGRIGQDKGRIQTSIEGQQALTVLKVLESRKDFSVVEIEPQTGRTNQIRIHFKGIGHPLLGEKKFAFRRDFKLKANRLCLHAARLKFVHPINKKDIAVESPLPLAMKNFLEKHPT